MQKKINVIGVLLLVMLFGVSAACDKQAVRAGEFAEHQETPVVVDAPRSDQDMLGSTADAASPVDGTLPMEPQSSGPPAIAAPDTETIPVADNCYYPSKCDDDWAGKCEDYCKEHDGFSHMSSDGCGWFEKKCCCISP